MNNLFKLTAMSLLLIGFSGTTQAAGNKSAEMPLSFTGTLISPTTCTIEEGSLVDFGQVKFNEITEEGAPEHTKNVNYQIKCEAQHMAPQGMDIKLQGDSTSVTGALDSGVTDMGIKLMYGSSPLVANGPEVAVDYTTQQIITAVLVKAPGKTLSTGTITSTTAKLQISYD